MKSAWRVLALMALLLPMSGCHLMRGISVNTCRDSQPYLKARSVASLQVPAGLDAPDTTNALRLPKLNEPAPPPRGAKQPCLDAPPPFKVQQAARTPQA